MKALRNYLDKIKPNFEEGGKLHALRSVFDGFETFLFVPNTTARKGVNIHDAIDSKRIMSFVVIALVPALLFGMYNVGYQHYTAAGLMDSASFIEVFGYGFLAVLPKILVSYIVGLGIEFIIAQLKNEEIQEGFLVSGMLIPMIVPVGTPIWMVALATAFAVIFCKEVFGGSGMNIFNPALTARMFIFFSYTASISGEAVWYSDHKLNAHTGATPLTQLSDTGMTDVSMLDAFIGNIPGCIGETSTLCILLGAIILLWTGVASWKIMVSCVAGALGVGFLINGFAEAGTFAAVPAYWHLVLGGFAFGAVFMATDPVTSAQTEKGKWIYGFLVGALAVIIRLFNPGYPEGMMLAILLMNTFAPLIDYYVVEGNIKKRIKRSVTK